MIPPPPPPPTTTTTMATDLAGATANAGRGSTQSVALCMPTATHSGLVALRLRLRVGLFRNSDHHPPPDTTHPIDEDTRLMGVILLKVSVVFRGVARWERAGGGGGA